MIDRVKKARYRDKTEWPFPMPGFLRVFESDSIINHGLRPRSSKKYYRFLTDMEKMFIEFTLFYSLLTSLDVGAGPWFIVDNSQG